MSGVWFPCSPGGVVSRRGFVVFTHGERNKDAKDEKIMIKDVRKAFMYGVAVLAVVFAVGFSLPGTASAGEGRVPTGTVANTPAAKPKPDPKETGMCDVLSKLPGYSYTYQGAKITVPDGKALLRELTADGVKGKTRERACKAMVGEYAAHN